MGALKTFLFPFILVEVLSWSYSYARAHHSKAMDSILKSLNDISCRPNALTIKNDSWLLTQANWLNGNSDVEKKLAPGPGPICYISHPTYVSDDTKCNKQNKSLYKNDFQDVVDNIKSVEYPSGTQCGITFKPDLTANRFDDYTTWLMQQQFANASEYDKLLADKSKADQDKLNATSMLPPVQNDYKKLKDDIAAAKLDIIERTSVNKNLQTQISLYTDKPGFLIYHPCGAAWKLDRTRLSLVSGRDVRVQPYRNDRFIYNGYTGNVALQIVAPDQWTVNPRQCIQHNNWGMWADPFNVNSMDWYTGYRNYNFAWKFNVLGTKQLAMNDGYGDRSFYEVEIRNDYFGGTTVGYNYHTDNVRILTYSPNDDGLRVKWLIPVDPYDNPMTPAGENQLPIRYGLLRNQVLGPGEMIYSPNMMYQLKMENNGNLVMSKKSNDELIWESKTKDKGPLEAFVTKAGLVLRVKGTQTVVKQWSVDSSGYNGSDELVSYIRLTDDGTLDLMKMNNGLPVAIYSPKNGPSQQLRYLDP